MRKLLSGLIWLGVLGGAALYAWQAKRLVSEVPKASVLGRVTVSETITRTATTNPVRNLQVYLFTLEATKPFEELQQKCRRAMAQLNADPVQSYQLCERVLTQAFYLIPQLPAMATARTNRDGSFYFDNVEAGRQYHVVGIKRGEDGRPIVIGAKTTRLRPGQKLTLELSENDPWTGPVMLR